MFRIQLIIALFSAGYFLHALSSFFPCLFSSSFFHTRLQLPMVPLVLNGALKTYF